MGQKMKGRVKGFTWVGVGREGLAELSSTVKKIWLVLTVFYGNK